MARAKWPGFCSRCNEPIHQGSEVVIRHGEWIHPRCAPGGDDE